MHTSRAPRAPSYGKSHVTELCPATFEVAIDSNEGKCYNNVSFKIQSLDDIKSKQLKPQVKGNDN